MTPTPTPQDALIAEAMERATLLAHYGVEGDAGAAKDARLIHRLALALCEKIEEITNG
jgi:hypothetical protein